MHFRSVFSLYVKISSGISTEFPHGSPLADPAAHRYSFPCIRLGMFQNLYELSDRFFSQIGGRAIDGGNAVRTVLFYHTPFSAPRKSEALREENGNLKSDLKAANEKADKLPGVQKELDDLKKQNEEDAKAREGKDYDALQKQFDDYKAEIIARDTKAAKEKAFRDILKDLNVSEKGVTLALKYQNLDSIELEEDGKIKGASDLRKSLKEDWGDYIVKSETKGADTATPPGGNGGSVLSYSIFRPS